jgi:hypothetical protein
VHLSLSTGYSQENLDWSIAGYHDTVYVNVLSELDWKKFEVVHLLFNAEYNFRKRLVLYANVQVGMITSGSVTDTDFSSNNRKDTLTHGIFDSNNGSIKSLQVGLGYTINFRNTCSLTPAIGIASDWQTLYVLKDLGNVMGDLRNTYKTQWSGVLIECLLSIPIHNKLLLKTRLSYHQVKYLAKANWNLISEFKHPVSFKHSANGYGIIPNVSLNYILTNKTSLLLTGTSAYWATGKGTDTLYLANGDIHITPLNGVKRNSAKISLGIRLSF